MKRQRTFTCAHCGADVPVRAPACPECGSDERTGWSEDAWAADLPAGYGADPDFDYDEFLRAEGLAGRRTPKEKARRRRFLAVGVLLCIGVLLWLAWQAGVR